MIISNYFLRIPFKEGVQFNSLLFGMIALITIPAEVPIQRRLLQHKSDVILKHPILCLRIISSLPVGKLILRRHILVNQ